jgi:hypothetical protein
MPPSRSRRTSNGPKLRVLQISDDQNLAISRLLLLLNQGYSAEHLFSRQVEHFSEFKRFDIFLICQSIDPELASQFIDRIRTEVPTGRILRVRSSRPDQNHGTDVSLAAPAGPYQLVQGLESLARTIVPQTRPDA